MRRIRRASRIAKRAFLSLAVLVVILRIGSGIEFAYRTNNICEPNEHILQSEADAIEVAKEWVSKLPIYDSREFGSGVDVVDAMNQATDCCYAVRTRKYNFVIVWEVATGAEKGNEHYSAHMDLSNCGAIFADTLFTMMQQKKTSDVWK